MSHSRSPNDLNRSAQANLTRIMPGALTNYAPVERWDDWVELDAKAWAHGEKRERHYPTDSDYLL